MPSFVVSLAESISVQSSFGDSIVESIGWTYENFADAYLGEVQTAWGLGATLANVQATGRSIGKRRSEKLPAVALLDPWGAHSSEVCLARLGGREAFIRRAQNRGWFPVQS